MVQCTLNCTLTYARKWGGKLNNEHWYDRVPISGETSPEVKITVLWNQQCKLKINQTS